MDQWSELKKYAFRQRQQRFAEMQRLTEEDQCKKKEVEYQQFLREQERNRTEQRLAEEKKEAEQRSIEKHQQNEARHHTLLFQSAEELRSANKRNREAQLLAEQNQKEIQARTKESPIETGFFEAWCKLCPSIVIEHQYKIGNRRVDFAHLETMTAIELDGHEFHSGRKARTQDYQRQREIEDHGWFFVRFTGSEVFHDVEGCVRVAWNRIQGRMIDIQKCDKEGTAR